MPARAPARFVLLALAAAFLLFAPYRRFTTDDAFIHYRFAENLAAGAGWSYNPGTPTHGDTAPLWVLLLAAVAPIAGSVPKAAKVIDAVSVGVAILFFVALARRRHPAPGSLAVPVLVGLFLLDPWLRKWSLAGMETPLALALVLAAEWLRGRARMRGALDPWSPLVLGIGTLLRPECGLLLVALAADIFLNDRGPRRRANLLLCALLPLLPLLPWLLYAQATFGTILPNTLGARRDLQYSAAYRALKLGKIVASAYAIPCGALLIAAVLGRGGRFRAEIFSLLGTALVFGFYLLWGVSVGARYLLLVTPLLALVGYGALLRLGAARPRAVLATFALAAVGLLVLEWGWVRFVTRWPEGMDSRLFEVARFLRDETPPGSLVAAHEIGVLGYVSGRPILDLAGLVSPDLAPVAHTGSVAASLASAEAAGAPPPAYLVWNANEDPDRALLAEIPGLEPLFVREVQREGSSHRGGSQYYTVYRFSGATRPRSPPGP